MMLVLLTGSLVCKLVIEVSSKYVSVYHHEGLYPLTDLPSVMQCIRLPQEASKRFSGWGVAVCQELGRRSGVITTPLSRRLTV